MVLMDWEPEVPVSAPAEVVGPLTFAQWKSLANSESALETVTTIKQPTSNDKVSEEETLLMCLDEVLAEWGI